VILIIGSNEEDHCKYIHDMLQQRGEAVEYLDTRKIPLETLLCWCASQKDNAGYFKINGQKILFNKIKSVYWRWNYGIPVNVEGNSPEAQHLAHMLDREINSAVDSIFSSLNCLWLNSYKAIKLHMLKPYQLFLMAQNNIRVPRTLVTNDKDIVMDFFRKNDEKVIFKPVRGGASTEKLTKEHILSDKMSDLITSPVQFQEMIEGVDIRVYCIKDKIFAAEIRANTLDFRDDVKAQIVPVELPQEVQKDCLKTMELLDLKYTGIDIRQSVNGEYVFIEANPAPMFIHFERMSGYPISQTLCDALAEGLVGAN